MRCRPRLRGGLRRGPGVWLPVRVGLRVLRRGARRQYGMRVVWAAGLKAGLELGQLELGLLERGLV